MISQPDEAWCPDCRTDRYGFRTEDGECGVCGADVVEDWPLWARARRRAPSTTASYSKSAARSPRGWRC